MLNIMCLIRCIVKGEPVNLSVTEKPPVEVDRPHTFSVSRPQLVHSLQMYTNM